MRFLLVHFYAFFMGYLGESPQLVVFGYLFDTFLRTI